MDVKTFRAATLQEALQQVRESLGPDASVLQTRELRRSRLGLFSQRLVEVEASVDVPVASRFDLPLTPESRRQIPQPQLSSSGLSKAVQSSPSMGHRAAPPATEYSAQPSAEGGAKLQQTPLTPAMFDVLSEMLDAGVEPQVAKGLLAQAAAAGDASQADASIMQRVIGQLVAADLRTAGPIEFDGEHPKVVALVGPTGVGKTTTLAKIAAAFRFDQGAQIGLISLDTFRLGAVDQLLQYAELVSAQLEVIAPEQVTGALQRLQACDLVLLDTAGRSPHDRQQLSVLADFLGTAEPDAVQLVVSATSSQGHARETLSNFAALNPTSLIITKLDEAVTFGEWLGLLRDTQLPVSYLTAGQHVPEDLAIASPHRLAGMMLGPLRAAYSAPYTVTKVE